MAAHRQTGRRRHGERISGAGEAPWQCCGWLARHRFRWIGASVPAATSPSAAGSRIAAIRISANPEFEILPRISPRCGGRMSGLFREQNPRSSHWLRERRERQASRLPGSPAGQVAAEQFAEPLDLRGELRLQLPSKLCGHGRGALLDRVEPPHDRSKRLGYDLPQHV